MKNPLAAACLFGLSCLSLTAVAGEHVYAIDNPAYKAECASCHIAYPPQLLPAESWRGLMAGLGRHFGTDASVDAKAGAEIGRFLEQNASRRVQVPPIAASRISETVWFSREHRKVAAGSWSSPTVKSAANCSGCHTQAEKGDFSERSLHVPR
jgi:nitrate/TMAO reductase-like tetraheme cytochrome c subunit